MYALRGLCCDEMVNYEESANCRTLKPEKVIVTSAMVT